MCLYSFPQPHTFWVALPWMTLLAGLQVSLVVCFASLSSVVSLIVFSNDLIFFRNYSLISKPCILGAFSPENPIGK